MFWPFCMFVTFRGPLARSMPESDRGGSGDRELPNSSRITDRTGSRLAILRMRHAAHVPQLQHDAPACGVHPLRHGFPRSDLRRRMDARRAHVALAFVAVRTDVSGVHACIEFDRLLLRVHALHSERFFERLDRHEDRERFVGTADLHGAKSQRQRSLQQVAVRHGANRVTVGSRIG